MSEDKYQEMIIAPGDRASMLAKDVCVASYNNNPAVKIIPRQPENFRGPVDFTWNKKVLQEMCYGHLCMTAQNDGAGGKPQFFTIIGTSEVFFKLGWEILVMVIDDVARGGAFPVVFWNDVNAKKVTDKNFHLIEAMFSGFSEALRESNQVNITGEFAIMNHSITAFCDSGSDEQLILNWAGNGLGLSHPSKVIDGRNVGLGMPIIGFWEPGYRCNGGTQFTNLIMAKWARGDIRNIWENADAMKFIKKLTVPSLSYAKTICRLNGWEDDGSMTEPMANMVGIAHLTGGGVGKFKEMLPPGIGAEITNMPRPAEVLLEAQEISFDFPRLSMTDKQCHTTFHGGCGEWLICKTPEDCDVVLSEAKKDGIAAYVIGETVASDARNVNIRSRFLKGGTITI